MALIDLKLIGEINTQALLNESMFEAYMLGHESRMENVNDSLIVGVIKIHKQVQNLNEQLKSLHQKCSDIANDNMAPYLEQFANYAGEGEEPPTPFELMESPFDSGTIHDLPLKIEQYKELVEFMPNYGRILKAKRDGFKQFFGNITTAGYLVEGENGERIIVPESEMPEDVVTRIKANQVINEINVEYCLDNYNTFRQTCLDTIAVHKVTGDGIACANEILKLFAPFPHKPAKSK